MIKCCFSFFFIIIIMLMGIFSIHFLYNHFLLVPKRMQSNFSNTTTKTSIFEAEGWRSRSFVHLILLFMWWNYTHFIIQQKSNSEEHFISLYILYFFAYDKLIIFLHRMFQWGGRREEFEKFVSWYKLLDIIIFPLNWMKNLWSQRCCVTYEWN